jgi:hypothetical protein
MSRNKKIRKRIAGWERELREHQEKIEMERARPTPNTDRITHWESEVQSFKKRINRLLRRLRRDW